MFEMFKRVRHKKASLSLSINAIVVLVLAIAMLGLGLAFTKTMFKKFGEKLTVPPPDIPATAEEPIVLPTDELIIKHGDGSTFAVNFYNDFSAGRVDPALQCFGLLSVTGKEGTPVGLGLATRNMDSGCVDNEKDCSIRASSQFVDSGTYKSFKFIVPGEATTIENIGQDVCEISFCAPASGEDEGVFDLTTGECFSGAEDGHLETKQIVVKVT